MSIYRQFTRKDGLTVYQLKKVVGEKPDGAPKYTTRLISKKDIPANVFRELQAGKEMVDDVGMDLEAPIKECLFCGQVCKLFRLLNGQTIYLCEEDYYGKTIGQIAQRVREVAEPVAA